MEGAFGAWAVGTSDALRAQGAGGGAEERRWVLAQRVGLGSREKVKRSVFFLLVS